MDSLDGQISSYLTPQDLRRISNLQILARLVVEGFCSGLHRSPHKGFSVEFKQHRPYSAGDEIRRLDWRVFGRSDRFYVREYEEETNLRAMLLLDSSGSMAYGRDGLSKHDYAVRLAACLAYLMLRQQDSVGLVTFDRRLRRVVPPRSRSGQLHRLFGQLQGAKPEGETGLGKVFHDLVPRLRRRSLLILLSDCFGDVPELLKALSHLRQERHEILVFQIWDPDELEFPFRGWTEFDSLERAGMRQSLDPAQVRKHYLRNLRNFRQELLSGCRTHGIDLVPFTTNTPYADALAAYLRKRSRLA